MRRIRTTVVLSAIAAVMAALATDPNPRDDAQENNQQSPADNDQD